jgi:hypothetical protein
MDTSMGGSLSIWTVTGELVVVLVPSLALATKVTCPVELVESQSIAHGGVAAAHELRALVELDTPHLAVVGGDRPQFHLATDPRVRKRRLDDDRRRERSLTTTVIGSLCAELPLAS